MGRAQKKQNKSLKRAREIRGKLKSSRDYSQARSIYEGHADDQSHAAKKEAIGSCARAVLGFMGSANAASGTTHRRERSRRSSKK